MAKAKIIPINDKIAKKAVAAYAEIEDRIVDAYSKAEDACVNLYLTREGESAAEAKERLKKEQ